MRTRQRKLGVKKKIMRYKETEKPRGDMCDSFFPWIDKNMSLVISGNSTVK